MSQRDPLRIGVITSNRADYGLLQPVMQAIAAEPSLQLQTIVTGAHLCNAFGQTWRAIEADGFTIDAKLDMELTGDDAASITHSTGRLVQLAGAALDKLKPDLALVLGDRYEILAVALAATIARIAIAHLCGGDLTEGAFDDANRHAITKLSHLHFPSNAPAAARIVQMGEDPARVHGVGSPGLDAIRTMSFLSREELEASLGLSLHERNLLVTFHPVTLDATPSVEQVRELLDALDTLQPAHGLIFSGANADPEGMAINDRVRAWCESRPHAWFFESLGHARYLSLMRQVDAVVGNSSSGLYEAPSMKVPTVNIGSRQTGRLKATSVIDCEPKAEAIAAAIAKAQAMDCDDVVNPYGDGHASGRIVAVLRAINDPHALLRKRFHEVKA
ncbi:MAG: UDP-N-acetylglucosamine 2-epimerase [Phycisphaeraceae bacterium]